MESHQLSVNGGSDKTTLALSTNYFNQDGIIINSNFKRYSLRLNMDHRINDRVKIGDKYHAQQHHQPGYSNRQYRCW